MLDPRSNQTFRSLIFPYGNYYDNKKIRNGIIQKEFCKHARYRNQSYRLWRIPKLTHRFLPPQICVQEHSGDKKVSCWINLKPIILSTNFADEWRLFLQNITLKRNILSQTDDFIATESSFFNNKREFLRQQVSGSQPQLLRSRGKWLLFWFLLYTQCLWEKTEPLFKYWEKGITWQPAELCIPTWNLGHHLILLVFLALLVKHQCQLYHTSHLHLALYFR